MKGMSAKTGRNLQGIEHLRQSVRDILTTAVGSRVISRDYGSRLPTLLDAPINRATLLQIYAATAESLDRWEPRLQVQQVRARSVMAGQVTLDITGRYLPDGEDVTIDGIVVN